MKDGSVRNVISQMRRSYFILIIGATTLRKRSSYHRQEINNYDVLYIILQTIKSCVTPLT